jgi:hypothetical protein
MVAPVKRRKRHRWIAVAGVVAVAVVAMVVVVIHRPGSPAPAQHHARAARDVPAQVRVGHAAATALHQLGRTANVFSCQSWYEWQQLAAVPAQRTTTWHAGYLQACAEGG